MIKDFQNIIGRIKLALDEELPGEYAQYKLAPVVRKDQMKKVKDPSKGTLSSVLILLYPENGKIMIPFIRRPKYDGVHSGQIAFPGGKYEKEDVYLRNTALREAQEEIGIKPENTQIIGELSNLYIPPSNYNVLPVVAFTQEKPEFVLQKTEVDYLLLFSLEDLSDSKTLQNKKIPMSNGQLLNTPCYFIQEHIVWGATAMILSEFIDVYKKTGL